MRNEVLKIKNYKEEVLHEKLFEITKELIENNSIWNVFLVVPDQYCNWDNFRLHHNLKPSFKRDIIIWGIAQDHEKVMKYNSVEGVLRDVLREFKKKYWDKIKELPKVKAHNEDIRSRRQISDSLKGLIDVHAKDITPEKAHEICKVLGVDNKC